jgi:hypothetical protein
MPHMRRVWFMLLLKSCLIAEAAGLNPADGMISVSCLLCVGHVAVYAMSWSLVERSHTGCMCVCVYSRNLYSVAAYDRVAPQKKK